MTLVMAYVCLDMPRYIYSPALSFWEPPCCDLGEYVGFVDSWSLNIEGDSMQSVFKRTDPILRAGQSHPKPLSIP